MKTKTSAFSICVLLAWVANMGTAHAEAFNNSGNATGDLQNIFVNIADHTMPSVVNIFTTKNMPPRRYRTPDDFFDFWADPRGQAREPRNEAIPRTMALGTGFVIEAGEHEGLILTNNHVIEGADGVMAKFTESDAESESPATIIGTNPELDIALLRVHPKGGRKLHAVRLGDSDRLKVGEWIAALGNPFGHGHSVSHGIVSAKARALPGGFGKYLQVDAPINPGNSGGPLVDLNGEVVGINNAIDARGPGIGFAIPINDVKAALPQLKANGRVERGYIGIGIAPHAGDGLPMVAQVFPNAPASRAGLKTRDVITKVNGEAVNSPNDLIGAITHLGIGQTAKTEINRAGRTLILEVKVSKRPDMRQARADTFPNDGD
ncbi:MAG: trypsin-like peptidase domain-containing protein [Deltaproteobacteria bacterium]|nr:trypsin-like peptidase domain-containing protein [Deltaproteobacteria bacterium]